MPNERVASGLVQPQGLGEEPLFYFTRCFLLFYQGLFSNFPTGDYKWSSDEEQSEIGITDSVPIPKSRVEQKPQIVTMRGPAKFANLTLDQMRSLNLRNGEKVRTDLVSCTMTINVIAKNDIEAQRIAWICMSSLRDLKLVLLRNSPGLHRVGEEIEMTPPSPPGMFVEDSDPSWVLVSVFCPFFFQWTSSVRPLDSAVVRNIELLLQSALLPAAATTTEGSVEARLALSPPSIRGRVINQPSVGHQRVGEITQTVKP